jgi:hypothetical protein
MLSAHFLIVSGTVWSEKCRVARALEMKNLERKPSCQYLRVFPLARID